jgi:Phage integrase, N-terminal SAM-like domain/Phage integrase family
MQPVKLSELYNLVSPDNKILESRRVIEWLTILEDEFSVCQLSHKTRSSYRRYIIEFILRKYRSHSQAVAEVAIREYCTYLAAERHVAASTQNVAFNALRYFYRHVMKTEPGRIDADRAKRTQYLPVVLPREDVAKLIACSNGVYKLINEIMYGCALRVEIDCLELRVKDVDLSSMLLTIRSKHGSIRTVDIPESLREPLRLQIAQVKLVHDADLGDGFGAVEMPDALVKKYPGYAKELGWQYLFPAQSRWVAKDGSQGRPHIHVRDARQILATVAQGGGF